MNVLPTRPFGNRSAGYFMRCSLRRESAGCGLGRRVLGRRRSARRSESIPIGGSKHAASPGPRPVVAKDSRPGQSSAPGEASSRGSPGKIVEIDCPLRSVPRVGRTADASAAPPVPRSGLARQLPARSFWATMSRLCQRRRAKPGNWRDRRGCQLQAWVGRLFGELAAGRGQID